MFYYIARIVFWMAIYIASALLTRRGMRHIPRAKLTGRFFIAVLLCFASFLLPVENLFITFSSLDSAYSYKYDGNAELVVEGVDSALVIGSDDIAIFPRSEHGWKLGTGNHIQTAYPITDDSLIVFVYQYKDSQDLYLMISNPIGSALNISDSYGSAFQSVSEFHTGLSQEYYTYYACIQNIDSQYILTVDGMDFHLAG